MGSSYTKTNMIPKQKFTWRYFMIGATLGLLTLTIQNRDMLPETTITHDIQEASIAAITRPSPTPYNFQQHFTETCLEASEGNVAYCNCAKDLLYEVDPLWDDGRGDYVYNETKQYLEVACMINS